MKFRTQIIEIIVGLLLPWVVYETFSANKQFKKLQKVERELQVQKLHNTLLIDSIQSVNNNQIQQLRDSLNKELTIKVNRLKTKIKKDDETINTINSSGIILPNF